MSGKFPARVGAGVLQVGAGVLKSPGFCRLCGWKFPIPMAVLFLNETLRGYSFLVDLEAHACPAWFPV